MAETTPSGGRERVDAVVARAVDEDRRERFRREDAEHEAADRRLAAAEASFQAGFSAGVDAAALPAQAPTPNLCRDCRGELLVLGPVCPACFTEANNVLADVDWWERGAATVWAVVPHEAGPPSARATSRPPSPASSDRRRRSGPGPGPGPRHSESAGRVPC